MSNPKDLNSPSPWNMRIRDEEKSQWLCDGEDDVLPYYGFDIRGGEVTAMQSMDWVYRQFEHGRKLIWERSTGLTDKNGKEIYEGDIVALLFGYVPMKSVTTENIRIENAQKAVIHFEPARAAFRYTIKLRTPKDCQFKPGAKTNMVVIGNIHENPELLGGKDGE